MKIHAKYYWAGYLILYTILIGLTIFLRNLDVKIIYQFILWVLVFVVNIIEFCRLSNYVKLHHRHVWDRLSSLPHSRYDTKSFRAVSFIFTNKDYQDQILKQMKANCIWTLMLIPFSIAGYFVLVFLTSN